MSASPIVARWELSRRLATRRRELGLDVKTITEHLAFTRNYWSAVENDRTLIAADKLELLLDLMDFSPEDQTELTDLRAAARKKGWWDEYPTVAEEAKRICGLEFGAREIRAYESLLVPGLLQTQTYAEAVVETDPFVSATNLETVLEFRRQRQDRLSATNPVSYVALISEAVLRQEVAGPEVQRAQLESIVDRMEDTAQSIVVRVIPFDANPGIVAISSTLLFFDFDRAHLPALAYQEAIRPVGVTEEGDEQFRRLNLAWQTGLERSLDEEKSLNLIKSVAGTM